ncbi:hydrogenase maturation protease [Sinomonas terrae]|uniref:Hydrogenase maturation protease n=1 Tax=Sinomonas terrae TaxID=2908838 RepID=A0ABS9TVY6_9MICC|nr:hydrogenase maturation protease [Sinomonas terrae]MCH6468584.1 hydrogenase maturation protease [Sinomonas terrae]
MNDVLVAGIGNIFLGDDGFGSEVARALSAKPLGEGVRVVDYGIRGLHLTFDLLDGVDCLIMVDAVPPRAGEPPGSLRLLEVRADDLETASAVPDAHGMEPLAALRHLVQLGGDLPLTFLVGCAAASVEEGIGLSEPVAQCVPGAVDAVRRLVAENLGAQKRLA